VKQNYKSNDHVKCTALFVLLISNLATNRIGCFSSGHSALIASVSQPKEPPVQLRRKQGLLLHVLAVVGELLCQRNCWVSDQVGIQRHCGPRRVLRDRDGCMLWSRKSGASPTRASGRTFWPSLRSRGRSCCSCCRCCWPGTLQTRMMAQRAKGPMILPGIHFKNNLDFLN